MHRFIITALTLLLHTAGLAMPTAEALDREVQRLLAGSAVQGLALAVVQGGQVHHVQAYGRRNAQGDPLLTDTVMYAASLTKAVFAYTVLQLAQEGRIDLDASIASMLAKPLPDHLADPRYGPWHDLKDEERWRLLTPRILLSHRGGFANFAFLEPDGKLRMHFTPGSRYAYSGEGYMLLQFVLEQGLGMDVGAEMQGRVFKHFGMSRTAMVWRPDFEANQADGWTATGSSVPHGRRSRVRAAGSMDTTIADFARFAAALARGDGLSAAWRADMTRPQGPIAGATQFPTLAAPAAPSQRRADLAAGLGVVLFEGPQGPGFFKGGHNDSTGNTWVCVEKRRSCVVLLANDVRAEALFPGLVHFILGTTGTPWDWEYGPTAR